MFGLSLGTFAQNDNNNQGGLFQRGAEPRTYGNRATYAPMIMPEHGVDYNQGAQDTTSLGSGIAVLLGLGAAYLVGKKRKEE